MESQKTPYGTIHSATHQGLRLEQEDHIFSARLGSEAVLIALMDGHRGSRTADIICEVLEAESRTLISCTDPETRMTELCQTLAHATRDERTGSTLLMAYISRIHDVAIVANIGDSYGMVVTQDDRPIFVPRHDVATNSDEVERAESRGGYRTGSYISVSGIGNLEMTRALGDTDLRPVISDEAEFLIIPHPRRVILASDGIEGPYDSTKPTGFDLLQLIANSHVAHLRLVQILDTLAPTDNASIVVWNK